MFWKRVLVGDQERVLVIRKGRPCSILMPGKHHVFFVRRTSVQVEKHDVRDLVFQSKWTDDLVEMRPELAAVHFVTVETNSVQVGIVYLDARLFAVMTPGQRLLFCRGVGEVSAELIDVIAEPELPSHMLKNLERIEPNSSAPFNTEEYEEILG